MPHHAKITETFYILSLPLFNYLFHRIFTFYDFFCCNFLLVFILIQWRIQSNSIIFHKKLCKVILVFPFFSFQITRQAAKKRIRQLFSPIFVMFEHIKFHNSISFNPFFLLFFNIFCSLLRFVFFFLHLLRGLCYVVAAEFKKSKYKIY